MMGADFNIHVFEGITERDLEIFFSNVIGSKYCKFLFRHQYEKPDEVWDKMIKTPNVWIGEVSWLKASLFDNEEEYIPNTVGTISELIGEDLPVLTEELRDKILEAFDLSNITSYKLNNKKEVAKFLKEQMGKRLFCISW